MEDLFTKLSKAAKMLTREQFSTLHDGVYFLGKVPSEAGKSSLEFNTRIADTGNIMARIMEIKKQGLDPREVLKDELTVGDYMIAKIAKGKTNPWQHISIGRASNNDIIVQHTSISKLHAFVTIEGPGRFSISDKDSANGTKVNALPIKDKSTIRSGDRLKLGSIDFQILDAGRLFDALKSMPVL